MKRIIGYIMGMMLWVVPVHAELLPLTAREMQDTMGQIGVAVFLPLSSSESPGSFTGGDFPRLNDFFSFEKIADGEVATSGSISFDGTTLTMNQFFITTPPTAFKNIRIAGTHQGPTFGDIHLGSMTMSVSGTVRITVTSD